MQSGSVRVKHPLYGRRRGSTKEELGSQLKGIISEIDIDRLEDRKIISEKLKKITSLQFADPTVERLEQEKETGSSSTIDDIINEMDAECQRILDSI